MINLSFNKSYIEELADKYPTPFYLYDEAAIRRQARRLYRAMTSAGVKGFTNFFAVKALPNPKILKILADIGMGMDCSSLAELELATMIGITDDKIMFSSNNTPKADFKRAQELKAIINFDDISQIQPFLDDFGLPNVACARYNPGDIEFGTDHQFIIGKPSEAKYGMTHAQLMESYKLLKKAGVKRFGLHTMLVSNERSWKTIERTALLLFGLAKELHEIGVELEFINLGGGLGIAYLPDEVDFELDKFATELAKAYKLSDMVSFGSPNIVMENGRYVTAEAGYLITRVTTIKDTYKKYIGVDASMSDLMRPGMYGSYHHMTVLGKENDKNYETVDVVGSLCENNDKFAIDRKLPKLEVGDYIVIHTVGAHAHTMGFQYNGKLRSAELLMKPDKSVELIRRAETVDDYFLTLV